MKFLVVSPAFTTDGTAFCAATINGSFYLYVTHDHAKTWITTQPSGFVLEQGAPVTVTDLLISPDFATDRTLVAMVTGSMFFSTDAGATFLQAAGTSYSRLTMTDSLNGVSSSPSHGVVLSAGRFFDSVTARSVLFDPTLPVPRPLVGTGSPDIAFLVPPAGSSDAAFAVGESGSTPSTTQHSLYACTAAYACQEKRASFPTRQIFDQAWFAPDFASSGVMLATTIQNVTDRLSVYVSRDRGVHLDPVPVLSAALDEAYRAKLNPMLVLAPGKPGSRTLFARIAGGGRDPKSPIDRLFRSDDDGKTWRVVAWGRAPWGRGSTGTMPFNYTFSPGAGKPTPRGLLTYTQDGRLLIPGLDKLTRVVWCSTDAGRTWRAACR